MLLKKIALKLMLFVLLPVGLLLTGCEDSGGGLVNPNPGNNDPDLYVAVGDSLTRNSGNDFANYPERLSEMIGKTVINEGSDGSTASSGAARVGGILARHQPGFLLVLYGMNDIIGGASPSETASSVESIVTQASDNQTLAVVATYPLPTGIHTIFRGAVRELNNELRSMAGRHGVPVVDLEAAFGEDDEALLLSDGLHPNETGVETMAHAFADVLM